jgi:splicing factor 3B subunit 4
MANIA